MRESDQRSPQRVDLQPDDVDVAVSFVVVVDVSAPQRHPAILDGVVEEITPVLTGKAVWKLKY